MSAVFCKPQTLTLMGSSTETVAVPKNLTNDEPGMVWRSSTTSGHVVFDTESKPFDTIAAVGSNQRNSDTFRLRMANNLLDVNGTAPFDQAYPAWSGTAPINDAISLVVLDSPVTYRYIRIDFVSPSHPSGYVEVCRLVVGKRVVNVGIDIGHEEVFDDTSSIEEGLGFTTIDSYQIRQQHKVTISHVKEPDYYTNWRPFLASVGMSKYFLYVERTDDPHQQHKMFFVRNTAPPKRINTSWDQQQIELQVTTYK